MLRRDGTPNQFRRSADENTNTSQIFSYLEKPSPSKPQDIASISRTPTMSTNYPDGDPRLHSGVYSLSARKATPERTRQPRSRMLGSGVKPPNRSQLDDSAPVFSLSSDADANPITRSGGRNPSDFSGSFLRSSRNDEFYGENRNRHSNDNLILAAGGGGRSALSTPNNNNSPLRIGRLNDNQLIERGSSSKFDTYPMDREPLISGSDRRNPSHLPPAMSTLDSLWLNWIVVIGVPAEQSAINDTIRRFQEFGDIVDHAISKGNWMFIKYASPIHAENAVARSLKLQSGQLLLSVQKMTSELASLLNLRIDARGALSEVLGEITDVQAVSSRDRHVEMSGQAGIHKRIGRASRIGLKDGDEEFEGESFERIEHNKSNTARLGQMGASLRVVDEPSESDIYLKPPKKSTSICSKIMEFFFAY